MNGFKARYEVDDGYVGGARPQHVTIDESDIEEDMGEGELRELYQDYVEEDFRQRISAYGQNEDEFVAWAKQIIAERDCT